MIYNVVLVSGYSAVTQVYIPFLIIFPKLL